MFKQTPSHPLSTTEFTSLHKDIKHATESIKTNMICIYIRVDAINK